MTPTRPLALLLGAALGGSLLSGCGGVDEALTVESGTADVSGLYAEPAPPLEAGLTAPGDAVRSDVSVFAGPVEARMDGAVTAVVRRQHVTAYDPATQEVLWRLRVPEEVCDASGVVGGRLALLTDDTRVEGCRQVALVDAGDGAVLWRRDLREDGYVEDAGVALTRTEVLAVAGCGEVVRFAADGGDALDPLGEGDCGDSAAVDDGAVATVRDLDERDGFALSLRDPATGRTVTRRTLGPEDGRVNAVITTDPLVVEVQEDGYRALQRLDGRGRRVGFLGRALDPYGTDTDVLPVARLDDVLVLSFSDLPGFRAYDVTTGEELWAVDDERALAGADSRGLVWTQPVEVLGEDGAPTSQRQVVRTPVDDPGAGEVLGGLGGPVEAMTVAGGDLLVDDGSGVDVVPLPGEGVGAAPAPGPPYVDRATIDDPEREDGDALPSDVADPCAGIGADTLAALGLRADVPPPASCRWNVYTLDRPGETSLTVAARAVGPGELPESEISLDPDPEVEEAASTATGAAAQIFSRGARRWEDLSGVGDEARATSRTNASGTLSTARIRVRSANVIVEIDASTSGPVGAGGRPVPVDVLEAAVRQAAEDVLDTTLG